MKAPSSDAGNDKGDIPLTSAAYTKTEDDRGKMSSSFSISSKPHNEYNSPQRKSTSDPWVCCFVLALSNHFVNVIRIPNHPNCLSLSLLLRIRLFLLREMMEVVTEEQTPDIMKTKICIYLNRVIVVQF